MNVQEYISSGIVESYVLGLADAQEQREFEKSCADFPEVLQARIAFEMALEKQAMQNAVDTPTYLKHDILATLKPSQKTPVVSITSVKPIAWLRYAAAIAVLLLIGSVAWNVSMVNKNRNMQKELADLKGRFNDAATQLADINEQLEMLTGGRSADIKMAALKGMDAAPSAYATVYWDTISKKVYLMVNNIPKPASDQQYQLWAMLNNRPVDLGVIPSDYFIGEKKLLLAMKNTTGAEAFAITLEKKGGSSASGPQGAMYTYGTY